MARGWESKGVESQQEEARRQGTGGPAMPVPASERELERRRRVLLLARARTAADLTKATAPAQRDMLERALADLDRAIAELPTSSS